MNEQNFKIHQPLYCSTTRNTANITLDASDIVYVATNGSDCCGNGTRNNPYKTICKALSCITDNSSSKPYSIVLFSGTYTVDNPVCLKEYVYINSAGGALSTVLIANDSSEDFFTACDNTGIEGCAIEGPVGINKACINMVTSGECHVMKCFFVSGHTYAYASASLSHIHLTDCTIYGTVNTVVRASNGGAIHCHDLYVDHYAIITTIALSDTPTSKVTLIGLNAPADGVDTACYVDNGGEMLIIGTMETILKL